MEYNWPAPRQFAFPPPDQVMPQAANPIAKPKTKPVESSTAKMMPTSLPTRAAAEDKPAIIQKSFAAETQSKPIQLQRWTLPARPAISVERPPLVVNPGESAPEPGAGSNIQLERIVLPNQ
jgi:hypothetical protein